MSSETFHFRICEVLKYFGIQEDFGVDTIDIHDNQSYDLFLNGLTNFVLKQHEALKLIDINCIISLLCEFTGVLKVKIKMEDYSGRGVGDTENEQYLLQLIGLFPYCQPNNISICKLFDILRTSARIQQQEHVRVLQLQLPSSQRPVTTAVTEWTNNDDIAFIPVRLHSHILAVLHKCVALDNPQYILFPGDKISSLQTSPVPVHAKKGYLIAIWVKPKMGFPSNEFCLFRGKNPNGSFLEFKCLPQENEGSFYVAVISRDDTTSDKLKMSPNQWHLLTIRHITTEDRDSVTVCVDGEVQFERDLLYPKEEEPQGIIWTIGNGFKGMIASFTLYEQPLSNSVTKFMYSLGPYVTDVKLGVSHPQSSFDSGYNLLGCLYSKGEWSKLCKIPSALSINPLLASLESVTSSPPEKVGKLQPDYIFMTGLSVERDASVIVNMNGKTLANLSSTWVESIMEAGGVNMLLYLFWTYSALKFEEEDFSDEDGLPDIIIARESLIQCLSVLSQLIEAHVDAKEQFIQLHGFHVIASCLSSWPTENIKTVINCDFINHIARLVTSLGPDSLVIGDGIASALQGLLFDFSIWGSLELNTLFQYLGKVSSICFAAGDSLFKFIGIQKILDIFRISLNKALSNDSDSLASSCADEIHQLLLIVKDSALSEAHKAGGNITIEAEMLLLCLEETNNVFVAERVSRLLNNIRNTSPTSLRQALFSNRFWDTMIVALWTKKQFSLEVRQHAFVNLVWLLTMELKAVPAAVLQLKKEMVDAHNHLERIKNTGAKLRSTLSTDSIKIRQLQAKIAEVSKGTMYAWKNVVNLSNVLRNSLEEGCWGNLRPSCLSLLKSSDANVSLNCIGVANYDFDNLLIAVVNETQSDSWLLIPFLPSLTARVSRETMERVLALVNVQVKTEDCQSEIISLMEDKTWMDPLVELLLIGIVQHFHETAGDSVSFDEKAILDYGTSAELALDTLSSIIVHKLRMSVDERGFMWDDLHKSFKRIGETYLRSTPTRDLFVLYSLTRTICLIIQRLVKLSDESWSISLVKACAPLLKTIHDMNLCGLVSSKKSSDTMDLLVDLDDFTASTNNVKSAQLSNCETQLFRLVIDLSHMVRQFSTTFPCDGNEWRIIKRAYNMLLQNISNVDDSNVELICREIEQHIPHITQMDDKHVYNPGEYKKIVADTLFGLLDVVLKNGTPSSVRNPLITTIERLLDYFRSLANKSDLSPAVQAMSATLGKLYSTDVEFVYKVLRAEWKDSVISFAEDSTLMDDFESVERLDPIVSQQQDLLDLGTIPDPSTALDLLDYAIPMVLDFGSPEMLSSNNTQESLPEAPTNNLMDVLDAKIASEQTSELQLRKQSAEVKYNNWLKVRVGISAERIDTERARMTHTMSLQDLSSEATRKHWKKLRRKIESESFLQSHRCQWKLGISHEGSFYGRKRLVLRPRFENLYATLTFEKAMKETLAEMEGGEVSTELLERALAKECSGYIKDVTRTESESEIENNKREMDPSGEAQPGTGWGIVDADGSDEGFGVVGLAKDVSPLLPVVNEEASSHRGAKDAKAIPRKKAPQDSIGELHLLEEKQKLKRSYDTGPCPTGASKCDPALVKLEARVVLVTASGNCWGYMSFNNDEIFFRSSFETEDIRKEDSAAVNVSKEHKMRRRRWRLDTISGIYLRRYRLRDSALEIFFRKGKHRNFFVDFGHTREDSKLRTDFAKALMAVSPVNAFKQYPNMSPFKMVFDHGVQEKWLSGKMSNFDYLMALNTIAGRTYNDLCQYPVMPWILSDYSSKSIDLADPSVYRDLSKPMGALNASRLNEFLDRFRSFEDNISTGIPAFMYGSHYSTMVGVVLHFLVRLQPFAALHQEMQNGHFDVPDRLFSSVPRSFLHNTTQLSEVKEITPEWFTTPDMFRNVNKFEFGQTQDGEVIDDVELPPWASSAEEFIRIHRQAMESDYVSEHLHEWIDLIFGYKQRGPDSVEANNVFYYLTYYGAVDHYMIQDESIRKATELQIAHFGQIPMQLFKTPHPARKIRGSQAQLPVTRSLVKALQSTTTLNTNEESIGDNPFIDEEQLVEDSPVTLVVRKTERVIVKMVVLDDRILCVLDNGVIEVLKYATSDEARNALSTAQAVRSAATNSTSSKESSSASASGSRRLNTNTEPGKKTSQLLAPQDILFGDVMEIPTTKSVSSKRQGQVRLALLQPGESLITVEKEYMHFEIIPKMPLPARASKLNMVTSSSVINNHGTTNQLEIFEKLFKCKASSISVQSFGEVQAGFIVFNRSSKLCFSFGRVDGIVSVREIDQRTGGIKTGGDFAAHRKRVVSVSTDTSISDYDVVASLDESGQVFIWTVLHPKQNDADRSHFTISRRPQKSFRCNPHNDMKLCVSSGMGIVVVVSGDEVYIFSFERSELLRTFKLQYTALRSLGGDETGELLEHEQYHDGNKVVSLNHSHQIRDSTFNGPIEQAFGNKKYFLHSHHRTCDELMVENDPKLHQSRRMAISDFGFIVVHIESFLCEESILEFEDQLINQHLLIAYTISGQQVGILECLSPVTALTCPDNGEVVISGHRDGSVCFYSVQNLQLLHKFDPSAHCVHYNLALPGVKISTSKSNEHVKNSHSANYNSDSGGSRKSGDNSAVIAITVGPNRLAPAVICISTEAGNLFIKALPDFIRWERNRSPSALAQLASVPLQAVKGTLLQAQNWTAETAGVFAQNAKSLADDALSEIKKMKRNSIVKGVVSFFGVKSNNDES